MSKARQLADLLDTGGDVISSALDNAPAPSNAWSAVVNKPSFAQSAYTDTTNASNINSGTIYRGRMGWSYSGSSASFLKGNGGWYSACTTHANCVTSNCQCACACNC